ncbi:hypothetical protein M8332_06930 (plasmid) [Fructilactobacillus ixorae]|uniref:Uncharacterized protein n=1 Tax=Fructilactobacillus ixorae TaxID=1750535 RepID=A0ABY5C9I0_9LACO|nr:hypothetical protein [Fructilactobacillus ixorae]USS94015.1 hypothetical protein M8332_06930 [Fructilactobacillus ixorae]
MIFYVEINKDTGIIDSATDKDTNGFTKAQVPERYKDFFLEYYSDFQIIAGEPMSVAIPIDPVELDKKIMQKKLDDLNEHGILNADDLSSLKDSFKFTISTVMDLGKRLSAFKVENDQVIADLKNRLSALENKGGTK